MRGKEAMAFSHINFGNVVNLCLKGKETKVESVVRTQEQMGQKKQSAIIICTEEIKRSKGGRTEGKL